MIEYREALIDDSKGIATLIVDTNISIFNINNIDRDYYINKKNSLIKSRLNNNLKYILAFDNNKIIGCMYYFIKDKECFIQDLYVDINYHNKGIGTYLFNYVKNKNINKIYLEVIKNSDAVEYYLKLNGKIIGEDIIILFDKEYETYKIEFEV